MTEPTESIVYLEWAREPKPNKMFSEYHRALVKFLRFTQAIPCQECGRRNRSHWTMLCSFEAKSMGFLVPTNGAKVHLPLAPVCQSHLLAPAGVDLKPPRSAKRKTMPEATS